MWLIIINVKRKDRVDMEIKEPVILVVDDDKDIVGAIAKLLEMEGYKVIKAYDGLEALEKAH